MQQALTSAPGPPWGLHLALGRLTLGRGVTSVDDLAGPGRVTRSGVGDDVELIAAHAVEARAAGDLVGLAVADAEAVVAVPTVQCVDARAGTRRPWRAPTARRCRRRRTTCRRRGWRRSRLRANRRTGCRHPCRRTCRRDRHRRRRCRCRRRRAGGHRAGLAARRLRPPFLATLVETRSPNTVSLPGPPNRPSRPRPPCELVVTGVADDEIAAGVAVDLVVAGVAEYEVTASSRSAAATANGVVAVAAAHAVVTAVAVETVVAVPAEYAVATGRARERCRCRPSRRFGPSCWFRSGRCRRPCR